MDTPDRNSKNQIGTPSTLSRFEDSPVFNYINNLSPIKPVKSLRISQSFNSLSFAAIPSVFTSPHVKDFKIFRRHQSLDLCKTEISADNENKLSAGDGVSDPLQISISPSESQESFNPGNSIGETSFEPHNEHHEIVMDLSRGLKYNSGSPDHIPEICNNTEIYGVLEVSGSSATLVPCVQRARRNISLEGDIQSHEIYQTEQDKEDIEHEWENLISVSSELLTFNSLGNTQTLEGQVQKSIDRGTSQCNFFTSELGQDDVSDLSKCCLDPMSYGEQVISDPSFEPKELDQTQDGIADTSQSKSMTKHEGKKIVIVAGKCIPFDLKPVSNLQRGLRRRCLVFDMTGSQRKNVNNSAADLSQSSSNLSQSDGIVSPDKQLIPCVLPGIGLHLNSIASTSKDYKIVRHETLSSGSSIGSTTHIHPPSSNHETTDNSLALIPLESERDLTESGVLITENLSQESAHMIGEELNPNSPKKKRCRLEQAAEVDSCKRCNCKKSKCLKLYCDCFAAGVYCVEPCSCQECFNKPIHEDTVLSTRKQIESRNPLAFAPKVIRESDSVVEIGDEPSRTPASARHKRGCNCKKSNCLKKYCECYQGGVGCSIGCRCEGCKNAFGRKDGTEAEPEEEETGKKSAIDESLHKSIILHNEEHVTPLQIYRSTPMVQMPFHSKGKPPRSSLAVGSSSMLLISDQLGKPNLVQAMSKSEELRSQTHVEDEMPDILRGEKSPNSCIKASSPNRKRVSPPNCDFGSSSPNRRSGRKLILQSIPSFPSLTQQ